METLAEVAHSAIAKHFRKVRKHEDELLETYDVEAVHQMRVGLRRLRTALTVFGFGLDLPKAFKIKQLKAIAADLGQIWDMDVMGLSLSDDYVPLLPPSEQQQLKKVIKSLNQQRQQQMRHMVDALTSQNYQRLTQACSDWLNKPRYQPQATVPLVLVLPDLLLPLVSQLLLHPGWQVGVSWQAECEFSWEEKVTPKGVQQSLQEHGPILHDLRKQIKRVRYQAELFTDFYGEDYPQQLTKFANLQDLLGHLHDAVTLNTFLKQRGKGNLKMINLPEFKRLVQFQQMQQWQQWQEQQAPYLKMSDRQALRHLFLAVKANPANDR